MSEPIESVNTCVDNLVAGNWQYKLVDFEDHMENGEADFRNNSIIQAIRN